MNQTGWMTPYEAIVYIAANPDHHIFYFKYVRIYGLLGDDAFRFTPVSGFNCLEHKSALKGEETAVSAGTVRLEVGENKVIDKVGVSDWSMTLNIGPDYLDESLLKDLFCRE